jgi:CCR4-NOT transcription complex subunit 2
MEAASTASSAASSVDGRSGTLGGTDYLNLGMFSSGGGNMAQGDLLGAGSSGFLNGFGNPTESSNQVSSSTGTSFDLSEFPSLGGASSVNAANAPGNGLAAALRQQQQILAHQQMLANSKQQTSNLYRLAMSGNATNNFNLDDFPALGGTGGGGVQSSSGAGAVSSLLSGSSVASRAQPPNTSGLYGNVVPSGASDLDSTSGASQLSGGVGVESGAGLLGGAGLGGLGGLRGLQQPNMSGSAAPLSRSLSSTTPASSVVGTGSVSGGGSAAGNALTGDYGLLGLLGVIRMTDADRNALALGSDLTLLGLNLGSAEQIYNTFSSPWSEGSGASKEPHYQVCSQVCRKERSVVDSTGDSPWLVSSVTSYQRATICSPRR